MILHHLHKNIRGFDFRSAPAFDSQLSSFLLTKLPSGFIVKDALSELINKTQENVNLTKLFQRELNRNGCHFAGTYIHREVGEFMGGMTCSVFLETSSPLTSQ